MSDYLDLIFSHKSILTSIYPFILSDIFHLSWKLKFFFLEIKAGLIQTVPIFIFNKGLLSSNYLKNTE